MANTEQKAGRGMIQRLQTEAGVAIILVPKQLELLRMYCGERLKRQLRGMTTYLAAGLAVQQIRCATGE